MKKIITTILAIVTTVLNMNAQDVTYYSEPVFESGEKATYNLYYNLGFIWVHAGDCIFKAQTKKYNNENVMNLSVVGLTTKTFDKMYTIRDTFEVYQNLSDHTPLFYKQDKHENSYTSHLTYVYNYDNGVSVNMRKNRKGKLSEELIKLDDNTLDLISSCYHFRNLDTDKLKVNQTIPFNMVFDNETYSLGLVYKGKTKVTLKNGKKYKALKFMPKLITGDLFEDEDDMAVYVTDDKNHIPLMIEAKIKVGSVKAMLSDISHNKYPLDSYLGKK